MKSLMNQFRDYRSCKKAQFRKWFAYKFFINEIMELSNQQLRDVVDVKCGNPHSSKRKRFVRRAMKTWGTVEQGH